MSDMATTAKAPKAAKQPKTKERKFKKTRMPLRERFNKTNMLTTLANIFIYLLLIEIAFIIIYPLFTKLTVPGAAVTKENIETLANVKIIVTAEAVQAEGFDDADKAWAAITTP